MNDTLIITSYVIVDDMMRSLNHHTHPLAKVSDAEVLTVAVVAANYFHNNHERVPSGGIDPGSPREVYRG